MVKINHDQLFKELLTTFFNDFVIDFPDKQVLKFDYEIVQLNRKLGNLSEEITTQIKSLNSNQLDALTEDLLDFQALDDLAQWLSNS